MTDNQKKLSDKEKEQISEEMPLSEIEDLARKEDSDDDETELPEDSDTADENLFPDSG